MSDFLQWISSGNIYANIFIIVLLSLLLIVAIIYLVAFIQGREISFWPPKIGTKSTKPVKNTLKTKKMATTREKPLEPAKVNLVVFTTLAENDCELLEISPHELIEFVKIEAKNHPKIFSSEFLSIPLIFLKFVVLLSWDKTKVTVERLLNREEAYPLNDAWTACLTLYRQATLLPYRFAPSETIVLSNDAKRTVQHYEKLLKSLSGYVQVYENINGSTGINIADFNALLDEAEFAIANNRTNISVARMETLLSTIHKLLVRYAPQTPKLSKEMMSNPKRITLKENLPAILVVDDESRWREIIEEAVQGMGFQVYSAATAPEAMQAMVEHDFDIVITDMLLSIENATGQDGREISIAAKKSNPKTKVIILTAYMRMATRAEMLLYDEYIDKASLRLEDIRDCVMRLVGKK